MKPVHRSLDRLLALPLLARIVAAHGGSLETGRDPAFDVKLAGLGSSPENQMTAELSSHKSITDDQNRVRALSDRSEHFQDSVSQIERSPWTSRP